MNATHLTTPDVRNEFLRSIMAVPPSATRREQDVAICCIANFLIDEPGEANHWLAMASLLKKFHRVKIKFDKQQTPYTIQACLIKALSLSTATREVQRTAWEGLGKELNPGEKVSLTPYSEVHPIEVAKEDCYTRSVTVDPECAGTWLDIARDLDPNARIQCEGKALSTTDCYVKAIEVSESHKAFSSAVLWAELGVHFISLQKNGPLSVMVLGMQVTALDCAKRAIEADAEEPCGWLLLQEALPQNETVLIHGKSTCSRDCIIQLIEKKLFLSCNWLALATQLSEPEKVTVQGKTYSRLDCWIQALRCTDGKDLQGFPPEKIKLYASAWLEVGSSLQGKRIEIRGEQMQAIDCYTLSLRLDPNDPHKWVCTGHFLHKEKLTLSWDGKKIRAQDCFGKAHALDPHRAMTWYEVGRFLETSPTSMDLGEKKSLTALDCYLEAAKEAGERAKKWNDLWHRLGSCLAINQTIQWNEQTLGAVECYLKALLLSAEDRLLLNSSNAELWGDIGWILFQRKECLFYDPDKAEWALVKGEEERGGDRLPFRLNLPREKLWAPTVRLTPRHAIQKAFALDSKRSRSWHILGMLLAPEETCHWEGRLCNREFCFAQAVTLDPTNSSAWHDLGAVLTKNRERVILGKRYSRKACYVTAVQLDPSEGAAWYHLAWLIPPGKTISIHLPDRRKPQLFSSQDCLQMVLSSQKGSLRSVSPLS